jgi:hypothetical protein
MLNRAVIDVASTPAFFDDTDHIVALQESC